MLKKFQKLTLVLLSLFIPLNALAYSNKIIAGGDTVGIKLNTKGILIVGSYDINGHNTLVEAGLKSGDIINQINNKEVNKVEEMVNIIKECNCNNLNIYYKRGKNIDKTNLPLYKSGNSMKTGLYVKDSISGIGTLTYIDPETKLFGVLGHEIVDNTTGCKDILNEIKNTIINTNEENKLEQCTEEKTNTSKRNYSTTEINEKDKKEIRKATKIKCKKK